MDDGVTRHDWSAFGVNDKFVVSSSNISPLLVKYNSTNYVVTGQSTLFRYKVKLDKNNLYVDGVLKNTWTYASFTTNYNALLFARKVNSNGAIQERSKMRLYNCKIWDNGTLIRNFIPCYRISDNELGLYDLVNNVFYTNQGTGTFIKGNIVGITEKIVNKNLADTSKTLYSYIGSSSNAISTNQESTSKFRILFIKCKPNTAYYIKNFVNSNIKRIGVSTSDTVPTYGTQLYDVVTPDASKRAYTTISTAKYLVVQVTSTTDTLDVEEILSNFMISLGNTEPTTYIAHQEQTYILPTQQPMRKIEDVKDLFVKVDGNWFERHLIDKYDIIGNETISKGADGLYTRFEIRGCVSLMKKNTSRTPVLSNRFHFKASGSDIGTIFSYWIYSGSLFVYLNQDITTVDGCREYFQNNNTYVDYLLEEPNDLPCTSEQTAILEAMVKSYPDVTHIYSEDGTPIYFDATALEEG